MQTKILTNSSNPLDGDWPRLFTLPMSELDPDIALSHHLRASLTSIRWNAELITSKNCGELTDEQRDYLTEIEAGVIRLSQAVSWFLGDTEPITKEGK